MIDRRMHRASAVIGTSIISATRRERIGTVADVLLDVDRACVAAFLLDTAPPVRERVLPYSDVESLEHDVLIARSGATMVALPAWDNGMRTMRASRLRNRRVITGGGRDIGAISDVQFDTSGRIEVYEVVNSGLGEAVRRLGRLPHSQDVTLGADAVIVTELAAATMDRTRTH